MTSLGSWGGQTHKASKPNPKPHNNANSYNNSSLGQAASIHVLSQKAMGTQRDAVRHLPLWRKRSRAISRKGGRGVGGGGVEETDERIRAHFHHVTSCAPGPQRLKKKKKNDSRFPIDMYTPYSTRSSTWKHCAQRLHHADGRRWQEEEMAVKERVTWQEEEEEENGH